MEFSHRVFLHTLFSLLLARVVLGQNRREFQRPDIDPVLTAEDEEQVLPSTTAEGNPVYLGCYEDQRTRDLPEGYVESRSENSIRFCAENCLTKGYHFFGLQYAKQCFCGNDFNNYGKKPGTECIETCTGDEKVRCGGTWRNSVYTTGLRAVQYLGCYVDDRIRDLTGPNERFGDNSIERCAEHCKAQGYLYAGLQWRAHCFCGNDFGQYGKAEDDGECDTPCSGNRGQQCGGGWRNSIYTTGVQPTEAQADPLFLGCYEDRRTRDLSEYFTSSNENSHEFCREECLSKRSGFFGVQNGNQCFCGNDFNTYGKKQNSDCNKRCAGNDEEECGGGWRNSVFTTGLQKFQYLGCYEDKRSRDLSNIEIEFTEDNTEEKCANHCREQGYVYAGLQYRKQCFCGNDFGRFGKAPDTDCNLPCSGNRNQKCGGSWRNSVYTTGMPHKELVQVDDQELTGVQYIGCFEDREERDLFGYTGQNRRGNTIETCTNLCRVKGFKYAGLQYSWQCFCNNEYGTYGQKPDSDCNKKCSGNPDENCGGSWRNSVYSTGATVVCEDQSRRCRRIGNSRDLVCQGQRFAEMCPQTCGKCNELLRQSFGPNGCLDLIENCAVLKEAGKCMTDPVFMMKNCADSCDACFIEQEARCTCQGDPHCWSFDDRRHDYQGMCIYTLVRDQCRNGIPIAPSKFDIVGDFKIRDGARTTVSMMKVMHIRLHEERNLVITFSGQGDVLINGAPPVLPYINHDILVTSDGSYAKIVDMRLGFYIEYGKGHYFLMRLRDSYQSNICGLCGDYNGDPNNDWIVGNRCNQDLAPGSIAEDFTTFGNSWRTNDFDSDLHCNDNTPCPEPTFEDECSEVDRQQAVAKCSSVSTFIREDATAQGCMTKLDDGYLAGLIGDCEFDYCHTQDDAMICNTLETMSEDCRDNARVAVEFRSETLCALTCEENMVFEKRCGECEQNCDNENVDPFCVNGDAEYCQVKCWCEDGFVRFGGKCVPIAQCTQLTACEDEDTGVMVPAFAKVLHDQCSKLCTCEAGGNFECVEFSCGDNTRCENNICKAENGFRINDDEEVEDIDECVVLVMDVCEGENTFCENTIGSFECLCESGFSKDDSGQCIDDNECNGDNECGDNSECHNLSPGYECNCKEGYKPSGEACVNVNECETPWHNCDTETTECIDREGSFKCRCLQGFVKQNTEDKQCFDKNECTIRDKPCGDNAECENEIGSFKCTCHGGYRMEDGGCVNINECNGESAQCDPNADCRDTDGSYTCMCKEAFEDVNGDGKRCLVKLATPPECNPSLCAPNARCVQNECECLTGFVGNGDEACEDVDECADNTDDCTPHSDCDNSIGGYACLCKQGYVKDGEDCININECAAGTDECDDRTSDCVDKDGGYNCRCKSGYEKNRDSGECENKNECESLDCGENAECIDLVPGYECRCTDGFSGSCENCINENECASGQHTCHSDADCIDTIGGYECVCKDGFTGDGRYGCQAVNPCEVGTDNCDENSVCVYKNSRVRCKCYPGYTKNGDGGCINLNECELLVTGCSTHATCTDTEGSFKCQCKAGYIGNGVMCTEAGVVCGDVVCDFNAQCTEGACVCLSGFEGTGVAESGVPGCTDINECTNGEAECHEDAVCVNAPGLYMCMCKSGFTGDGESSCVIDPDHPCSSTYCGTDAFCEEVDGEALCKCEEGKTLVPQVGCLDTDECKTGEAGCEEGAQCINLRPGFTCLCPVGFSYNKDLNMCEDEDECYLERDLCSAEAKCLNTIGGYSCKCLGDYTGNGFSCEKPDHDICLPDSCGDNAYCTGVVGGEVTCHCQNGYKNKGSQSEPICKDINECRKENRCAAEADCTNTAGSYSCQCKPGYRGDGVTCHDVDECLDDNTCGDDERCVNKPGSHLCVQPEDCDCGPNGGCNAERNACDCNGGYVEVAFYPPLEKCQDKDECIETPCGEERECVNTKGGFQCNCLFGSWDGQQCLTDACNLGVNCHEHATCAEVENKPVCSCQPGYEGDGFNCEKEPDSCSSDSCPGDYSTCVETSQGSTCVCNAGYDLVGDVCEDINECDENSCGDNSRCENRPGYYQCLCEEGYIRMNNDCADYNECEGGVSDCDENAICINTDGGHTCECKEGFTTEGDSCRRDYDCALSGPCDENAECRQDYGNMQFMCICKSGYKGTGLECEDVSECESGLHNCHEYATCTDTEGGFTCECLPGTIGDGIDCQDINECLEDPSPCTGEHIECLNKPTTYECVCKTGYVMEGEQCVDLDECAPENRDRFCGEPGDCTNEEGSYTCTCPPGYDVIPTGCKDKDKCTLGTHDCDLGPSAHIKCENTPGSFSCDCQDGFEDIQGSCTDIDECADNAANDCDQNADCNNVDGSYECECQQGYKGNGFQCVESDDECENTECTVEHSTCVLDTGGQEQCVCEQGYRGDPLQECIADSCDIGSRCPSTSDCVAGSDGVLCQCKDGFQGDDCTNINECEIMNYCGGKGTCEDTIGHYLCQCENGYWFNTITCTDVDECQTTGDLCEENQQCVNTEGGYNCVCASGYRPVGDICENINECEGDNSPCHADAVCTDEIGGFNCACKQGYEGNGADCTDNNECLLSPSVCPDRSECINIAGGFDCQCYQGFNYVNGKCIDIDECDTDICGDNSECVNLIGGHTCLCQKGFERRDRSCQDINECERQMDSCHDNARCTNSDGGFTCSCDDGYYGNGFICQPVCGESTCPYAGQTCHVAADGQSPECRCKCAGENCLALGPVCADNGNTFNTYKEFDEWRCQSQSYSVEVAYWGECKTSCDDVRCEDYEECVITDGQPSCVCPSCSDVDKNSGPVCSNLINTYSSRCALQTQACRLRRPESVQSQGPCAQDCEVGDWAEFDECSVTCGVGTQTRLREVLKSPDESGDRCPVLEESEPCFMPTCADDRCDDFICERPGAQCVVGGAGQTLCECPSGCQIQDESPVCGLLYDREPATFRNLCKLRRVSCRYDIPHTVLHEGACDANSNENTECHTVPTFDVISEDGCQSHYHVSRRQCAGTCGDVLNSMCCKAASTSQITVTLKCDDGSTKQTQVETIDECQCEPQT